LLNPLPNGDRECETDIAISTELSVIVREPKPLGNSRRQFTPDEDLLIREGRAQGLTWCAIASLLPGRKRATCFNRFKTLIGQRRTRQDIARITRDTTSPDSMRSESPSDWYFV
jgi:hypothetical protein